MSRLAKTIGLRTVPVADTRNHEGFPAYLPSSDHAVAELLFLGTVGNTYYATGEEWGDLTINVTLKKAQEDPRFLAQAAVLARRQGFVRSAPLMALMALLSEGPRAQALGSRIFERIVQTGDDLRNYVALAQSQRFRQGYGGITRRLAAAWLNQHLDEYQAIKYNGSGDRLSLRNILRMTHPRPTTLERDAVFQWVVRGTIAAEADLPMIRALDGLSKGTIDPVAAIVQGHLPFEAVMPRIEQGNADVWRALLDHAPYMFLLRSLNAFGQAGVWSDPNALEVAVRKLTDPARVAKAMQFPFRYYQASEVLIQNQAPRRLVNAVYDALELSLGNMPDLGPIRLAVAPDVSGSMVQTRVAGNSSAAIIAGLFSAALWKRYPEASMLPFGTQVVSVGHISPRDSIITIAHGLGTLNGGGTDLSAPIRTLLGREQEVDLFVGLTDSEDWAASGGWNGQGFLAAWHTYRKQVASNAQAVLIQLAPSGTRVAPSEELGVHYVYGWSDTVLQYLSYVIKGHSIIDHIRHTEI